MNYAKRLYELQLIDSEIQRARETLAQLNSKIGNNEALLMLKAELDTLTKQLTEIGQKRRNLEWSLDDLGKTISKINDKLYGGKVGNPKELISLEQEKDSLNARLAQKENELLDLMNEEEETQRKMKMQSAQVDKVEVEWQQEQKALIQQRDELESHLLEFERKRQALTSTIDPQAHSLYEKVRLKKGQTVVKVEQGRCQGCRITLSVNEWQRAKSGALIQCSSCGKILYLE